LTLFDQNRVLLVKAWRDQAALDVHSKGPMPHSEAANDCTNR
jgi:quinol monooxygenase YgiN